MPTGRFPDGSRFGGAALYAFLDEPLGKFRMQVGGRASVYRTTTRVGDDYGGDVDSRVGNATGEIGLVYRAAQGLSLRARAAQAFRAPNIYDLTLVGDVPGGIALPNPDLSPERSYTLEMGASWTRGSTTAELTAFRIDIDDLLERSFGTFQGQSVHGPDRLPVLTIQNIGSATVDGVEGAFSAQLPARGQLDLSASWTLGDAVVARDGMLREEPFRPRPPGDAVVSRALGRCHRTDARPGSSTSAMWRPARAGSGSATGSTAASRPGGPPRSRSTLSGRAPPGVIVCASPRGSRTSSTSCIAFTARESTPQAGTSSCGWTCGADRARLGLQA